jgi:tetratricopeptide (TPR) repeat protein
VRSLACSLTATWQKISSDARKISSQRSDIQEIIFATPKTVTRKMQQSWEKEIKNQYGWKLIIIEHSEFLAILERPDSQWLCKQYLNLSVGYFHLLKTAEKMRNSGELKTALKMAKDAEKGALGNGDWETACYAQILEAELYLDIGGICDKYRDMSLKALLTARDNNLTALIAECLALRANSIVGTDPNEALKLLDEAELVVQEDNLKIRRWICLIRAEQALRQGLLDKAAKVLQKWETLIKPNERVDRQNFHHLRFRLAAEQGNYTEALDHLNRALRRARMKKRWMSVGWMLHEKARYLARQEKYKRAAHEADKAREIFEKLEIGREALDAALLTGQLFFESREAERASALADYVLSKAGSEISDNIIQDALQLKTRSLQVLNCIDEAREWNQRFRKHVGQKPQALVVADVQDAMLAAQSGDYEKAESLMEAGLGRAKETGVQEEIKAAIKVHWAQIKMDQGKYREARSLAESALQVADRLPPKVQEEAAHIVEVAQGRAPLTSIFEDFLNNPAPLDLAGTAKSGNIQAAHQEIIRPLLDWTERWPEVLQGIYDFWGRGNLARFILNHRGFLKDFHVTVEATTVNEARQWTTALCPLVDVLTILWKGPMLGEAMNLVPVHRDYSEPGGWGYAIAAGTKMRPDKDSEDWNWSPAMGWATLLPGDAVKFLFEEARAFFEAGRLFLLPALNVGCIDEGHGPLERMFNDATNAVPFLSSRGDNRDSSSLDSLPLPYFPNIPPNELAEVIEGEGDSLLKTRLALRSWAQNLANRNRFEAHDVIRECFERVESALRDVGREFRNLARKLDWAQQDGTIDSYIFDVEKFDIGPENPAAAELAALHDELQSSPWYTYFRLSSQGYRWDLMHKSSFSSVGSKHARPDRIYHWLVPPEAGWTIPSLLYRS